MRRRWLATLAGDDPLALDFVQAIRQPQFPCTPLTRNLTCQVTDPAEREQLMALAKEGKQRAWWQEYDLPYATYVGESAIARRFEIFVASCNEIP